jgi:hypothetical protein
MAQRRGRDILFQSAMTFVGNAAFPRLAYRLRWPTRLGPRGLLAYTAFNTALGFGIRTWLVPILRAAAQEQARQELGRELSREPTDDEVAEHLRLARQR